MLIDKLKKKLKTEKIVSYKDYKVLGKDRLNDPIIGHPAMKGRRWMIDYGYDSGNTFKKLKGESMEYKDFFKEFENEPSEQNNKLKGGVGDATAPSEVNTAELAIGVQVEMEHTNDSNVATEIALDHLMEDPEYYSKLVKAGLAKEFMPTTNSGFGDPDHPINDKARMGDSVTSTAGNNIVGTIGGTSDGRVDGRRSEPILQKECECGCGGKCGCDSNIEEQKSKSTSKDFEPYAKKAISILEKLKANNTKPKDYTDEDKVITRSYIESVQIGLGKDHPMTKQLEDLKSYAYKWKKLKPDLNEKKSKKPKPTKPDLWSRAKSLARNKFDVYPSAYANAWAAKWYKSKGGGWRM